MIIKVQFYLQAWPKKEILPENDPKLPNFKFGNLVGCHKNTESGISIFISVYDRAMSWSS